VKPALQRRTVLVVDDEAPSLELFRFILENGGFRAVLASRGAEALRPHMEVAAVLVDQDLEQFL
jgi:CheY-like chemotaxis protein